jgi:hypothetical protein
LTRSDLSTIADSTFRGYRAALVRQIVLRAKWSLRKIATSRACPDRRAAQLEGLVSKSRLVTTPRTEAWNFCAVAGVVASAKARPILEFTVGRYESTACGLVVPIGLQPAGQPRPGDQRVLPDA